MEVLYRTGTDTATEDIKTTIINFLDNESRAKDSGEVSTLVSIQRNVKTLSTFMCFRALMTKLAQVNRHRILTR